MDRYQYTTKIKTPDGITYFRDVKYPIIPLSVNDIYVITTAEDRYDRLTKQYYNDVSLWWVILAANEDLPQDTLFPTEGTQLRIPSNINNVLNSYSRLNQ